MADLYYWNETCVKGLFEIAFLEGHQPLKIDDLGDDHVAYPDKRVVDLAKWLAEHMGYSTHAGGWQGRGPDLWHVDTTDADSAYGINPRASWMLVHSTSAPGTQFLDRICETYSFYLKDGVQELETLPNEPDFTGRPGCVYFCHVKQVHRGNPFDGFTYIGTPHNPRQRVFTRAWLTPK